MLQPNPHDGYLSKGTYPKDPNLLPASPDALSNSGLVISNSNPRFQTRLHTARRVFGLVPMLVFLLSLALFMSTAQPSLNVFALAILRVIAISLSSSIVCIGAYGFFRYLLDRSPGL